MRVLCMACSQLYVDILVVDVSERCKRQQHRKDRGVHNTFHEMEYNLYTCALLVVSLYLHLWDFPQIQSLCLFLWFRMHASAHHKINTRYTSPYQTQNTSNTRYASARNTNKHQIRISIQHKQTPDTQQHTTQPTPDTQQHATQQTPDTQQHTTQQTLDTHYNISAQYNNIRYEIRITTVVQNHIRYYTSRYIHGSLYHTVYIRIYIYTPVGTHSL